LNVALKTNTDTVFNSKGSIMQTRHAFVLTLLAGAVIGAVATSAIHAQQAKPLPAYVVAELEVTDPAKFGTYAQQIPGTLAPFGGHFLVRRGKIEAVEGDAPKGFVIIAFDSMEKADAWEHSPAYEAIRPIRHASAKTTVFIAEGLPSE
jgi:uncharacterized protein (DUF1330 family)